LATLTFEVSENTIAGEYPITIEFATTFGADTPVNAALEYLDIDIMYGGVTVEGENNNGETVTHPTNGGGWGNGISPQPPTPPVEPGESNNPAEPSNGTQEPPEFPSIEFPPDMLAHWSEDYIGFVVDLGIMRGFPDGTFRPDDSITRAEFSTAFARLLAGEDDMIWLECEETFREFFGDVVVFYDAVGHWAERHILFMIYFGFVNGIGDNLFAPDAPITREQIAAILHRSFGHQDVEIGATFVDHDDISYWAVDSVYSARNVGIMQGDQSGNFNPQNTATRGEIAAVLTRLSR